MEATMKLVGPRELAAALGLPLSWVYTQAERGVGPINVFADYIRAAWLRLMQLCESTKTQPTVEADAALLVECSRSLIALTKDFEAWRDSADGKRCLALEAEHEVRFHAERLMDLKAEPEARLASARWVTGLLNVALAKPQARQALRLYIDGCNFEGRLQAQGIARPLRTPIEWLREVLFPEALIVAANAQAKPRRRKHGSHRWIKDKAGNILELALVDLPFELRIDQLVTDAYRQIEDNLVAEVLIPRAPARPQPRLGYWMTDKQLRGRLGERQPTASRRESRGLRLEDISAPDPPCKLIKEQWGEMMARVTHQQRQVLHLVIKGYQTAEIARLLGTTSENIRKQKSLAITRLRQAFGCPKGRARMKKRAMSTRTVLSEASQFDEPVQPPLLRGKEDFSLGELAQIQAKLEKRVRESAATTARIQTKRTNNLAHVFTFREQI